MKNRTAVRGQTHLIVGAASGIGLFCACRLLELGANVYALDIDFSTLERALGGECPIVEIDITDDSTCKDEISRIIDDAGAVHGLVNSAGVTGKTSLETHRVEVADFDAVYAVNLRGGLILSQAIIPHMISRGYGRIVHMASIRGE